MIPVFLFLVFLSMTAAPLRAADSENQIDEDPDVTEIISKVNANIKTPLIYGDIAPSKKRNTLPCTAKGCKWPKKGNYVYIPAYISPLYSNAEISVIIRSLVSIQISTCIRFLWWTNEQDFLYFFPGSGCWSNLGYQGGPQPVSLKKDGCLYRSIVQHEVNHALGFHHEQSRSDRDTYVEILTENIEPGREKNFVEAETNNLGTPYDFNSIMHYHKFAFSKNGRPTILSKAKPNRDFGRATSMSKNDIARINKFYGCP